MKLEVKLLKKLNKQNIFQLYLIALLIYISNQEQMTLILRCLDISTSPIKIEEYFLEFIKVDVTTGLGLFN